MVRQGFRFIWLIGLLLGLAACGNQDGSASFTPTPDPGLDSATGLPLNPDPVPAGQFIVQGTIVSMTLLQDNPEFVVRVPSGKSYRLRTQPLTETHYDSGELIRPADIRQGMGVRATVWIDEETSLLVSDNLVITP